MNDERVEGEITQLPRSTRTIPIVRVFLFLLLAATRAAQPSRRMSLR